MKKLAAGPGELSIGALILTVRGQKVILDAHLGRLYGVTTKRLNEQVKRNLRRFSHGHRQAWKRRCKS